LQLGTLFVRVVVEVLAKNNLVGEGATDRERVTHHGPLRFTEQAQHLAEVMD